MCFSLTLWFLRGAQDPIPSRTRPSNPSAPMVLSLKTWESRSLQGLPKTHNLYTKQIIKAPAKKPGLFCIWGSGQGGAPACPPPGFEALGQAPVHITITPRAEGDRRAAAEV